MNIDDIIAVVEWVESNLLDRYNRIDWAAEQTEREAAEREGREYEEWYCNECGVDLEEYEDAGHDAQELHRVLEALRTLKAEQESVGAGR